MVKLGSNGLISRFTFYVSRGFALPLRSMLQGAAVLAVAWLVASAPLLPLLMGIGMMTATLILVRWPWLIWLGMGIALPVTSSVKLGPLSVTDLLLAVAVALWLGDGVRRRTLRLRWSPISLALLLYVGALYLSLLASTNLGEAVWEVIKWAEVLIVLLILPEMVPPARVSWLVAALLIGGAAQALFGLYQFIYRIGPDWFLILGRFMRASGSFRQPNPFAGYLGLILPVALSLALWAAGGGWRMASGADMRTTHYALRTNQRRFYLLMQGLFYVGATGLLAAGLIASWSRGGWLGAAVGIAVVVLVGSRQAAIMGAMATLLLVVALLVGSFSPTLLPDALRTRVQEIPTFLGLTDVLHGPVTDENFSVIERVAHWVAALRMWERSLWLGVGPGNYAVVYPEVYLLRWAEPLGHAHNIYLNVLAETGLVGFTFFLLLWGVILVAVWRQFRRAHQTGQTWQAALAVGVLGIIAHLSIHNFFDNLFVQGMYLHIALWLALLQTQTQSME